MSEYEIDVEVVEQLKISERLRGPLEPVVLGADGHLVDGHQRKAADPDWPEITNPKLKTEEDCVLFEIDKNWHRTNKDENWKRKRIERLARLGNTVLDVIRKTGLPDTTVYRYYPSDLKDQVKANAGRLGGEAKSATSVEAISQDIINQSEESARSAIVECANCHLGHRFDELKTVDQKLYCPRCVGAAHVAFENEKKRLEREAATKEKPVTPKILDSYGERKSHMQTADPEVDRVLFARLSGNEELRGAGWRLEYHQKHVTGWVEDDVCLINDDLSVKVAVFFDGPVHNGKRMDKDEVNRDKVERVNGGVSVLALPYKGTAEKEFARLEEAVLAKVRGIIEEGKKFDVPTTGNGKETGD